VVGSDRGPQVHLGTAGKVVFVRAAFGDAEKAGVRPGDGSRPSQGARARLARRAGRDAARHDGLWDRRPRALHGLPLRARPAGRRVDPARVRGRRLEVDRVHGREEPAVDRVRGGPEGRGRRGTTAPRPDRAPPRQGQGDLRVDPPRPRAGRPAEPARRDPGRSRRDRRRDPRHARQLGGRMRSRGRLRTVRPRRNHLAAVQSAGPHPFGGPMVVIVDAGVVSAGETVAGQFKGTVGPT
jgi:hypothetical protein